MSSQKQIELPKVELQTSKSLSEAKNLIKKISEKATETKKVVKIKHSTAYETAQSLVKALNTGKVSSLNNFS